MMSDDVMKLLTEATFASSAAIAIVLVLRVPMRQLFGASVAYTLWGLIPLALIAVLIPARDVVVTTVIQPTTASASAAVAPMLTATAVQTSDNPMSLALMLWIAGMVFCAFWFARQQQKFIGSLGALNLCYEKVFLADNNSQGPAVVGVVQPRIVLPLDFERRYSREEQNLILTHEKIHLERGDTRINLVAAALRCIFWFNPLLHWADGRFRFDQELSTDANVLSRFPAARKSYADAMLKTQMAIIGLPVACHWQAHHPLKERILMLKKATPGKIYRLSGLCLVAVLCFGGAFAAWSTQPANVIVTPAEVGLLYDIRMEVKVDRVDQKPISIREVPGKEFAVSLGEKATDWSYRFSVTPIDSQFMFIKGEIRYGKTLISKPAMQIANGKNSAISVMTKDGSSIFNMNFTVSQVRNGKWVPPMPFNGDKGAANGTYLIQDKDGKGEVMTYADLLSQVPEPVSDDKIKTQARIIPGSDYVQLQAAARKAGYKSMKVVFTVGAKGELFSASLDDKYSLDETTAKQLNGLLARQQFEPAKGMNDEPVISKLSIEF
jgi:beta-lactamase regulating signal transducer with metallopeptidase domain